jgi:uncharacterized membrane protein
MSYPTANQRKLLLAGALLVGLALALWFLNRDATQYLTLKPANFTPYYWPRRYGLLLHITGGFFALMVGLVQIWLGLTGRTKRLHRSLGRLYVLGVILGSAGAFYMATTFPPPLAAVYASGLWGLGIAWVITTSRAYIAVRRGDYAAHRAWMIRSYVVTFGFVTLRVIQAALMAAGIANEDDSVAVAAWLCWTVPLALTEVLLRRHTGNRVPRTA